MPSLSAGGSSTDAQPGVHPRRLAIIGDVFCDVSATGLSAGLPPWGGDRAVSEPIRMLPGGSGLNSTFQLAALQADPKARTSVADASGIVTTLHAPLADDDFGSFLEGAAKDAGVEMRRIQTADRTVGTGVCLVTSTITISHWCSCFSVQCETAGMM